MNTHIEENYLKAIYKLQSEADGNVSTSQLALEMGVQAASVTDMLKKLSQKGLIDYKKYKGVELTAEGARLAIRVVRKHRLWEVFLVDKLGFSWADVHEVAEQLEHVQSAQLIDKLDEFLGFPRKDPHGDPIPDAEGVVRRQATVLLTSLEKGERAIIAGVKHDGKELLDHLEKSGLVLNNKLEVLEILAFDGSMKLKVGSQVQFVSHKLGENIYVIKS